MNTQHNFIPNYPLQTLKNKTFAVENLSNIDLWLDAADTATITRDASNKISVWADKSGNGNHAEQSTSTAQPTLISNSLNGLPVVSFNGTSNYLDVALNIDYTVMPELTLFIVYQKKTGGGSNQALFGQDNGMWDRFALLAHATVGAGISTGSSNFAVSGLATNNTWRVLTITLANDASSGSSVRFNRDTIATFTESHDNSGISTLRLGDIGTGSQFAFIDLAEIISCSSIISDVQIKETQYYLNRKWDLGF